MKKITHFLAFALIALTGVACSKVVNKLEVTAQVAYITSSTATLKGFYGIEPATTKIDEVGFYYGTDQDFLKNIKSKNEGGEFRIDLDNLTQRTTYCYQAYVKVGDITKKTSISWFETLGVAVRTEGVEDITATSAMCYGYITVNDGAAITERGICYSTHSNPTTSDTKIKAFSTGTGSFSCILTGLTENTTYYVKAYAKNSTGMYYGEQKEFRTLDGVVSLTTSSVTNITATSAMCSGNITSDGGAAITERGVCYSTNPDPTTSNTTVKASSVGTGSFSCTLTGLTRNTTYYVRAYAKNSTGTYYGEQKEFMTSYDSSIDYIENGTNLGKSIPVYGDWDGISSTPNTYLHWAPVNCGCKAEGDVNTENDKRLGLLYQWGYGDMSLYDGKANASYYSGSYLNGSIWCGLSIITGFTSDKWNDNQGPCPEGWRLPTSTEFKALFQDYNWVENGTYAGVSGYKGVFVSSVFFPAAGCRITSGTAINIGAGGYFWSSSPLNNTNAYYMYFNSSNLKPASNLGRAYGLSVRCVHDPQ